MLHPIFIKNSLLLIVMVIFCLLPSFEANHNNPTVLYLPSKTPSGIPTTTPVQPAACIKKLKEINDKEMDIMYDVSSVTTRT